MADWLEEDEMVISLDYHWTTGWWWWKQHHCEVRTYAGSGVVWYDTKTGRRPSARQEARLAEEWVDRVSRRWATADPPDVA